MSVFLIAFAMGVATEAMPAAATHAKGQALTISTKDFPKEAYRNGDRGRTVVRFLVGVDGRVEQCESVTSSGSATLDAKSCEIARRGRFKTVARDAAGRAVPEWWRWALAWLDGPSIHADEALPESIPQIDVAIGAANWTRMATLAAGADLEFTRGKLDLVEQMLKVACKIGDARPDRFDIAVRYALKIAPNGDVISVLVEDLGCRPLAQMVAGEVLAPSFRSALKPPGGTEPRWYASSMRFARQ
ncbi:MAG: energy transducer TonB [Sphingomonadaceae bacterium]|nr:energy transducer TonB [Sphingomonadaceae bacterium]